MAKVRIIQNKGFRSLWYVFVLLLMASNELLAQEKTNVIVFIADDLGWEDIGVYGNPSVHTPNMDRLAKEGMMFNRFFLTASSCSPSRSSILTGLYPHSTGAMNLHENMSPDVPLLVEPLKQVGYFNMLVGKSHGTNNKDVLGKFDYVDKVNWARPWEMGNMWLRALENRPKDQPFFLWAASIDPHRPFGQGEYPYFHDPDSIMLPSYYPDLPEIRKELAEYYDEISRFDHHIGMVLDQLEKEGILENTLIIVLSDNGRAFSQAKTRINSPGLKSPLIIRYPKMIHAGSECNALVSAVDLSPTILDFVNTAELPGAQGKSFLSLLKGEKDVFREYAYGEHNWHSLKAFERVVITDDYMMIKNWLPEFEASGPGDVVREPSYQAMRKLFEQGGLAEKFSDSFISPRPAMELFDLNKDPLTLYNLAGLSAYQTELKSLVAELEKWMKNTGDEFPGEAALKGDLIDRRSGQKLD
ncbi:sulfatase family protein [Echinicola shivajiensis]|uniref:sulfatase family protein n=1 Tax=Echinicola shivajiensis TaxID=1035916 RepID=UPI001BFC4908|nr:sulfatase [Echinicola shivajiensis]